MQEVSTHKVDNVSDVLSMCVCICVCMSVHAEALMQTPSVWTLTTLAEGGASKIWAGRQVGSQAHTWPQEEMPGGGAVPGPQKEVPDAWSRQADPLGHLEASPQPGGERLG